MEFEPGDIVKYSLGTVYLIVRLSNKDGDWGAVALKNGRDLECGKVYPYNAEMFEKYKHSFVKLGSLHEL